VKWIGCAEDENRWEPRKGMTNPDWEEEVERFHTENLAMPDPGEVE